MARERMTPEDKLLKVIETPFSRARTAPFSAPGTPNAPRHVSWRTLIPAVRDYLVPRLRLTYINRGMMAVSALITLFLAVDLYQRGQVIERRRTMITAGAAEATARLADVRLPEIDTDLSLQEAQRRNIFSFLPVSEPAQETGDTKESAADEDMKNLVLVGIIWDPANPQAIIELAKQERTFLVNPGDPVGDFAVKTIEMDRVILEKDDKEWVVQ